MIYIQNIMEIGHVSKNMLHQQHKMHHHGESPTCVCSSISLRSIGCLSIYNRDYDPYKAYGPDAYGIPGGQASAPPRHDVPLTYQQQKSGYPLANQQPRQQTPYANTAASSYPPTLAPYYGAQQRA
jgi:hypothetical protein